MSRFLPDDLFVGAENERLSFVRRSRGYKPSVLATFELHLPKGFWDKPDIDLVGHSLPAAFLSGTRASIVVADRLVRYFLVERPQGARSVAEIEQAAALRFEELYGENTDSWQIEMDLPPWACNFLACGLPEKHLLVLQQLFASLRVPVQRIAPFGVEQWNRHGRRARSSGACFVALSQDTAWLTLRRNRRWLAAAVHGLRGDIYKELPEIIRREFARHGIQDEQGSQVIYVAGAVEERLAAALPNTRLLSASIWPEIDKHHACRFQLALSSVWPACK